MLDLPILNVRLRACAEDWQQMTPTAHGRHCAHCDKTVVDFTAATQADLDAARAAAPGGHLCGRFRTGQLASTPRPPKRRGQRQFLVALVLVFILGLTSGEAWAQVRKAAAQQKPGRKPAPVTRPATNNTRTIVTDDAPMGIVAEPTPPQNGVYGYVEQLPEFRDGGQEGTLQFIRQHLRYPAAAGGLAGRVFVNFVVGATGQLREFQVLKGLHPALDAEALRVARLLDGRYRPGKQNGRAVDVSYTIPVTFRRE